MFGGGDGGGGGVGGSVLMALIYDIARGLFFHRLHNTGTNKFADIFAFGKRQTYFDWLARGAGGREKTKK